MGRSARVRSIDVIRAFRPALHKFAEEVEAVLTGAEAEVNRTRDWLERDRLPHWKREIRIREEDVTRARTQLILVEGDATVSKRSTVEPRKVLQKAKDRLEEARRKLHATQHWSRALAHEEPLFKGRCQAMHAAAQVEVPKALDLLNRLAEHLDEYVAAAPPGAIEGEPEDVGAEPAEPAAEAAGSMSRPASEQPEDEPETGAGSDEDRQAAGGDDPEGKPA